MLNLFLCLIWQVSAIMPSDCKFASLWQFHVGDNFAQQYHNRDWRSVVWWLQKKYGIKTHLVPLQSFFGYALHRQVMSLSRVHCCSFRCLNVPARVDFAAASVFKITERFLVCSLAALLSIREQTHAILIHASVTLSVNFQLMKFWYRLSAANQLAGIVLDNKLHLVEWN